MLQSGAPLLQHMILRERSRVEAGSPTTILDTIFFPMLFPIKCKGYIWVEKRAGKALFLGDGEEGVSHLLYCPATSNLLWVPFHLSWRWGVDGTKCPSHDTVQKAREANPSLAPHVHTRTWFIITSTASVFDIQSPQLLSRAGSRA